MCVKYEKSYELNNGSRFETAKDCSLVSSYMPLLRREKKEATGKGKKEDVNFINQYFPED